MSFQYIRSDYSLDLFNFTIECPADTFQCTSGSCAWSDSLHCSPTSPCIPLRWKCDYEEDCTDGSDEVGCDGKFSIF